MNNKKEFRHALNFAGGLNSFSVCKGRFAVRLPKTPGKIKLVAEPQLIADAFNGMAGFGKQKLCPGKNQPVGIFTNRHAGFCFEFFCELAFRNKQAGGNVGGFQLNRKVAADKFRGL